jgi:hypothetical protein
MSMAIDGIQTNLNSVNPYSAAAEKAVAAQRAASARKKARRRKGAIELTSNPEQAPAMPQWMGSGSGQARSDEGYRAAASAIESDFG